MHINIYSILYSIIPYYYNTVYIYINEKVGNGMDEFLVQSTSHDEGQRLFVFFYLAVCLFFSLKCEVRVDSSGTTETDRYCSDMGFLY